MIRLIFRELKKHTKGLIFLLLCWAIGGYFIYENRHQIPVLLSRLFLSLPESGSQDAEKAYDDYILPAQQIIAVDLDFWCTNMPAWLGGCTEKETLSNQINLEIMEKACRKYTGPEIPDKPHWLESIREWNISPYDKSEDLSRTVEPMEYWDENNETVLLALEKLIQGTSYAWEIPADIRNDGNPKTLLVAEIISRYAKAVCRYDRALMAWGDYMEFQELRAGVQAEKNNPDAYRKYKYPSEKSLFSLRSLKNNENYIRSLREYSAGSAPETLLFGCRNAPLNLVCASPDETIKMLNKMIYFSRAEDLPGLYLKLAKLHMLSPSAEVKRKSLDYLAGAENYPGTKKEALIFTIRYLLMEGNTGEAYKYLLKLKTVLPEGGRNDGEYRRFARTILMRDGKHKEADCFSEKSETVLGVREHCKNLNL